MNRTSLFVTSGVLAVFSAVSCSEGTGEKKQFPSGGSAGAAPAGAGGQAGTGGSSAGKSGAGGKASGGAGSSNAGAASAGTSGSSAGESASGSGGSSAGGAGSGGKSGAAGGGAGGKSGAGGSSGSDASGGTNAAGADGEGGAPVTGGGCAGRDLLICEDFETTALGEVPDGWDRHGDLANVDDDQAHGGERSLKLSPTATSERRIYRDASVLGSAHWGRVFYRVDADVPDPFVHSTMVSFIGDGPENGLSEYRVLDTIKQAVDLPDIGGRHNFIFNVQIIGKSEFGTETDYEYEFDGEWHCAEYHIQASNQSYELFLDGESILSVEGGAGNYDDTDIPDEFEELRVGWVNYQDATPGFTAWIDDIAFDDQRIGCD
jgi:hypothetical protein